MKIKSKSGLKKRIKTTGGKKKRFLIGKASRNHLLINKSKRQKNIDYRELPKGTVKVVKRLLPHA